MDWNNEIRQTHKKKIYPHANIDISQINQHTVQKHKQIIKGTKLGE